MSRRKFLRTGAGVTASAIVGGAATSAMLTGCAHTGLPEPVMGQAQCGNGRTFSNWAGTISCQPARYCQPRSEQEVIDLVKQAAAQGQHVRPVGAGHSWAPLVLTRDVLVNLDRMQNLVSVDAARRTATVQGGIRLKNLTPLLAQHGLGMANLGSIREQSIAGATATGTHGTGLALPSIHAGILALRVVTGAGEVRVLTPDDGDLFQAARVSLGALGIVTEVTLQCVANYDLEYAAYWCRLEDVLPRIDALLHENTRVRLWWPVGEIFDRDRVLLTTMNAIGSSPGALSEMARTEPATAPARGGTPLPQDRRRLLRSAPPRTEPCRRVLHFVDNYVKVLTVPLLHVPHRECEYAVPVERTAEALRRFRDALDEGSLDLDLPIEVRFAATDDALLSTARGGVCYIGASTQHNPIEVFQRFEPIMRTLGGRPHWAKCFSLTQDDARRMYPAFDRFREIRKQFDPQGIFSNEHLRRLFD